MRPPKVVHVHSQEWAECDPRRRLYIGRAMPGEFMASAWANWFHISVKRGMTREVVLAAYENWLRQTCWDKDGISRLISDCHGIDLLGCWCKAARPGQVDHDCHGDILVGVLSFTPAQYGLWLYGQFSFFKAP